MQFKKLFLTLLLGVSSLSLKAQEAPSFPFTGTYTVQLEDGESAKNFNKVIISNNTFQTLKNDLVTRNYRIVAFIEGGYKVEQYYTENDEQATERDKFLIKIDESSDSEYHLTIFIPYVGTDRVHLVKVN